MTVVTQRRPIPACTACARTRMRRRRRISPSPPPSSSASPAADPRRGQGWRRDGRRDRGVAGGRPERHRAQGRGRDDRLQPRQGHRRHRLRRPAPRPREHRRFLRRSDSRHRRQGAGDRALHRRGSAPRDSPIPTRLARDFPDLDLYHPWDLPVERAIELGREAEAAALAVDPRLTNSEGATVARSESEFVYANSNGFSGGYRSSRHHIDCSVIGEDRRRDAARLLVHGRARAARICRRADEVGASPASAPRAGSARASSARSNARCCSRRPKPPTSSAASCRRSRAAASIASRRSCSIRWARRSSRRTYRLPRGAAPAARPRQRAVRQRRRGHAAARRRARRRRAGLFSRQLFGAQARHGDHRQRRRQPQPGRRARRRRSRRAAAAHGPRPLRHRAAGAGRQPGHRRLSRAAPRASGSRTARSPIRSRRSRSPATCKRHVPRHRRGRQRRRSPRLAAHRIDPGRPDDDRRALTMRVARHPRTRAMIGAHARLGPRRSTIRCRSAKHAATLDRAAAHDRRDRASRRRRSSSSPSFPASRKEAGPGAGRGAAAHRRAPRAGHRAAHAAVHDELPEEHRGRVAAVARGVRSREGVHRGLPDRAARPAIRAPSSKRWRAILPWVLVRLAHYKGLDGKFRLFRYSHWIPAQWREFHELYEFARMRGWQREQLVFGVGGIRQARRVVRAGIPEDAAADAPRLRQLHARPGRVGGAAARGLDAVADADAAAGRRRAVLSST